MSARAPAEETSKAVRLVASLVIVALVAAGATEAVRAAYGAFSDDFTVTTRFARAGQGLRAGSDVKYRGVNVGKVRSVTLRDRQVDVVLALHRDVRVPSAAEASVRPKTVFGEKYVELSTQRHDHGPYLAGGDRVASAGTGLEVEELLDTTDHLFRKVDATELATLVDELVRASRGEGDRVAHLIDRSVAATAVVVDTLDAQLRAVDSMARFARQHRDVGPSLNGINANLDELLPTFNAARRDYERLLADLRPFADRLADLIEVNEADIGQLLDDGDNIVRVLTAHKANISETIRGLDTYTTTLADAIAPGTLPDGSRYGNMKLFIDLGDLQGLLCSVLGPDSPGADLSAVRAALADRVPQLACPGDAAASVPGTAAPSPSASGDGHAPAVPGADQPPDPVTELVSALASPAPDGDGGTVGDLLAPLLGGGS